MCTENCNPLLRRPFEIPETQTTHIHLQPVEGVRDTSGRSQLAEENQSALNRTIKLILGTGKPGTTSSPRMDAYEFHMS
jgi:hypothetical protein